MVKVKTTARILSYLGVAKKAGKLVSGQGNCENAIKSKKALLVLLSGTASDNTVKHFSDMASYRDIPIYVLDSDMLGNAVGKEEHKTVCITDSGFANAVIKEINLNDLGVV
jgi:ribosomal protein L7Ae-like RNA K-turn-binding protein